MDDLTKDLTDAVTRDFKAEAQSLRPRTTNGPDTIKTVRLTEQIDTLIGDFKRRIAMLEKIKESL